MALILSAALTRLQIIQLQLSHYSPRIQAGRISNSTDGEYTKESPPMGEEDVRLVIRQRIGGTDDQPVYGDGVAVVCKVWIWPGVYIFELGTGKWGAAFKFGGREHGFLVIRQDLCLWLEPGRNVVALARIETYKPMDSGLLHLLGLIQPTEPDKRYIIPPHIWDLLGGIPSFDAKKSPVHMGLDPLLPVISSNRLGNPILLVPGRDADDRYPAVPPFEIPLNEIVGKGSMVLDMRPEMRAVADKNLEKLRIDAANDRRERDNQIRYLRGVVAAQAAINDGMPPQDLLTQIKEAVAGKEQTGETD